MDSASARPINPASVKPAVRMAPADLSARIQKLLLDRDLSATNKVSGIAQAFEGLDAEAIAQATRAVMGQVPGDALECLKQALQRVVDGRAAPGQSVAPSQPAAPAAPMRSNAPADAAPRPGSMHAANDQLAQLFRPPAGTLNAQPRLDQRLREALGEDGARGLSKLSKDYSDFDKQRAALEKKWGEGSPQLQEALQGLEQSPLGQRVTAGLSQVPESARGMLIKVLEHERFQIGKDPIERAHQANALIEGVTAMRDMQIAQGLAGVKQHATVFKAVERMAGSGRDPIKSGIGQQAVFKVAALKADSSEWGAIEAAMQAPVPQEARQAAIAAARELKNGWGPVQAIAPVMGLADFKPGAELEFKPEGLASLSEAGVYQALQQSSARDAQPVMRTYRDVFAAAQPGSARRGAELETMAEAGIGQLAVMAGDAKGWQAVEARLGRRVSGAQRDLISAAARQLQQARLEDQDSESDSDASLSESWRTQPLAA